MSDFDNHWRDSRPRSSIVLTDLFRNFLLEALRCDRFQVSNLIITSLETNDRKSRYVSPNMDRHFAIPEQDSRLSMCFLPLSSPREIINQYSSVLIIIPAQYLETDLERFSTYNLNCNINNTPCYHEILWTFKAISISMTMKHFFILFFTYIYI